MGFTDEAGYLHPSTWRARTANGIPYKLVSRSGTIEYDMSSAKEVMLIQSHRLFEFALESFPQSQDFENFNNRRMPGTPNLLTQRISWKSHVDGKPVDPYLSDVGAPNRTYHPVLELTVEYTNESQNETFLEISGSVAGEVITSSASSAKWELSDGTTEDNDQVIGIPNNQIVSLTEWTLTWKQIPRTFFRDTLMQRLRNAKNKINSKSNETLFDAPPETLLFLGFDYKEEVRRIIEITEPINADVAIPENNIILSRFVTVTAKILEKYIKSEDETDSSGDPVIYGHNHFWRDGHGWQKLLPDGTNPTYQETDYDVIFTPPEANDDEEE